MKNILSIDGHCDTLQKAYEVNASIMESRGITHIDIPSLEKIAPHIQFMAMFCNRFETTGHFHGVLDLIDFFYKEVSRAGKKPVIITDAASLEECIQNERLGVILSVEGAYLLDDNLQRLRLLYSLGVRCISLTWNPGNKLCGGIGDEKDRGLGEQGTHAIKKMNDLGVLIDLSHISERGFWDIIELTDGPVIASHSNCLSLCPHERNLNDRQLKAIGGKKGVVGVNFVPDFLGVGKACISGVADHIEHIIQEAGIDSAGLGSDFDGTDELPDGITGAGCYVHICEELLKRGYSEVDVSKVMGGNFLRVIRDTI